MGRRKTAVAMVALAVSIFSATVAYGAEESAAEPRFVRIVKEAEAPEKLYGEYIPVLMYHHFTKEEPAYGDGMVVSAEELEDHLKVFKAEGYRCITLEQLNRLMRSAEYNHSLQGKGLGLEGKYICITMDDGYYSNYKLAYPLFKKYQMPASVFAVTDFVTEQYGMQKFTWKQAQEMDKAGWLRVYSHSADHIPVEAGQEEAFLACMQKSDSALQENLKQDRVKAMAYPNGLYTEKSQELLQADGYELQFTVNHGIVTRDTDRNAIPRITVASGMSGEDLVRKIELAAENTFAAEREGK